MIYKFFIYYSIGIDILDNFRYKWIIEKKTENHTKSLKYL